ncbi:MAG: PstS family phosphate ABC transporter substrate-binding protein [Chloroflexi bacterium]|nr:PstS family phosphate ABC transporter substrate-binding protein [Chloroflexota bacterium]
MRRCTLFYALLSIVLALTSAVGCREKQQITGSTTENTGKPISISGAYALYPMVVRWSEEYKARHPGIQFDVQAGGAGKGMTDVLAGAVDIAMISRSIKEVEVEQGAVPFAVCKDAVVFVVNAQNPVLDLLSAHGLTKEQLARLFLNPEPITWGALLGTGHTERVNVYTRADSCGAAEMVAKYLGVEAQEDLHGIAVNGDPGVAEAVRRDPLGIGYNNIGFAYDLTTGVAVSGLQVVPLDLNGNYQLDPDESFYATKTDIVAAIAAGRYPSPPARALYLVTKGSPDPVEADFIRWVLTDGQAFVDEVGYVSLPETVLQTELGRLP